ncbi:Zinc finger, RING/FYVE/PHD-type [Cynara cardunculus var. scolymus]|uniref:RING-type E3 ubiquitin transferase n=2 Tax=Cynara cardunculus var. scolymus TaxID=59895 RepID=A0A103XJY6_CYNCS|nr:Zinc finger, RING/FYVE/PHD-type [Cynara cardunculus var. scolymus]
MYQHIATTVRTGVEETAASPTPSRVTGNKSFDANVVMVLSVLLCALICSLGLNFVIRCVLRCSSMVHSESITDLENTPTKSANIGLNKKALKTFPTVRYWKGLTLPGLDKECVICLSEFVPEELVKILPKCNHGFHARCIDKWLSSHSSCPTCRHSLVETCQKILSGGVCGTATLPQLQGQESQSISTVVIMPLQPEHPIRSYEM